MRRAGLAGLIMFFMLLPWNTAWAGPSEGALLSLLPPQEATGALLTRGGFAVMLAAAARIKSEGDDPVLPADVPADSWYAQALQALWREGYIQGYPYGQLRPEQEITNLEAAIMTARALGLPNEINAPNDELPPQKDIPYGFNQYAFLQRHGLLPPGDPMAVLTPAAAAKWLAEVFSSDARAKDLVEKCRQALAAQQKIATRGKIGLHLKSRPGLPFTEEIDRQAVTGEVVSEVVLPGQVYQAVDFKLEGGKTLHLEQFAENGSLYRRIAENPGQSGEWEKLNRAPDVTYVMRQQQNLGLPAGLFPYLRYRFLGTSRIADQEVLGISFYTRTYSPSWPGTSPVPFFPGEGLGAYFNQPPQPIRSLSYWGVIYLEPRTYLPVKSGVNLIMAFNPPNPGQPAPVAAMELYYQVDVYRFR
ncbi:MAG: S-layer homology domain-containing protein [Moorella humiferrea]|nr:S-layer homology domain-containing protein [Moorella humiferrea]